MAQYAHALVAERSFPVLTSYYQRADTNVDVTGGTNATSLPLPDTFQHGQTNWPGYYSDPSTTQPSPNFPSYVGHSASTSSSSYDSSWQQNTSQPVTAVGSSVSGPSFSRVYHPSESYEAPFEPPLHPDYPTSSQRTVLPPSPSSHARSFLPVYGFRNDRHQSPSSHTSFGREMRVLAVDEHQYPPRNMDTADEDQSTGEETESVNRCPSVAASTTTTTSHTSVKIEPNDPDGCFIMELPAPDTCGGGLGSSTSSARAAYTLSLLSQSLAPPTEVPLRATQASKEMKQMMGVFRLNPFAMHSLSVKLEDNEDGLAWDEDSQPPWCGGRPLDEEPLTFEFQLDLNGSDGEGDEDEQGAARQAEESRGMELGAHELSQLRSFSPSFELHPEGIETCDQESLGEDTSHLEEDEDQEYDQDQDQRSESWGDVSNHSEVDTNSTTTTPSVHTPFNDSPDGIQQGFSGYGQRSQHTSSPSVWDPVGAHYQVTEDCHSTNSVSAMTTLPIGPKLNAELGYGNVRAPSRLHTTISHPYLRKSLQNHQTTHSHSHNLSHSPIQSQSHPHPSPGFSLPPHQARPSQGQVHLHHPQLEHNEDALRCQPLHFSYADEQHRVYAPISTSSSSSMMGDIQRVDEPLPPSYMRVIRSRHQDLDQGHHMSARGMSGASKGVGGYGSSSETTNHTSALMHSQQQSSGLVSGHGVNRRWSLPETGVIHVHGGPFLSGV